MKALRLGLRDLPIDPQDRRQEYCTLHSEHSCFGQDAAHAVLPK
jgi:hypothetical protein